MHVVTKYKKEQQRNNHNHPPPPPPQKKQASFSAVKAARKKGSIPFQKFKNLYLKKSKQCPLTEFNRIRSRNTWEDYKRNHDIDK